MTRFTFLTAVSCVVAILALSLPASAVIVAYDDASDPVYVGGNGFGGLNGGNGFGAWSTGQENGSGFGGAYVATQPPHPLDIESGPQNEAWGVYGNSGGFGAAVRPFVTPLAVGMTFSLDMDNQGVDGSTAVGFSLRNAADQNLMEFYFLGGNTNYTVAGQSVVGTTPGFETGGLRLTFTLTDPNSFAFTMDRLANGVGVDNTATGDLLSQTDQAVAKVRLFNSNGGPDVYFNTMSITAVPELSAFVFGGMVCGMVGICYGVKAYRRKRMVSQLGAK